MALRHGLIAILATTSLALAGMAAAAPAPVPAPGGTVPTGGKCAGLIGKRCASPHDYCMLKPGECHVADAQGVCRTKPKFCNRIYMPVCGCNGKTYSNACEASASGVSVMARGKCKAKPKG